VSVLQIGCQHSEGTPGTLSGTLQALFSPLDGNKPLY
jgi:hypothetical protein